jgi:hypothetical protein
MAKNQNSIMVDCSKVDNVKYQENGPEKNT